MERIDVLPEPLLPISSTCKDATYGADALAIGTQMVASQACWVLRCPDDDLLISLTFFRLLAILCAAASRYCPSQLAWHHVMPPLHGRPSPPKSHCVRTHSWPGWAPRACCGKLWRAPGHAEPAGLHSTRFLGSGAHRRLPQSSRVALPMHACSKTRRLRSNRPFQIGGCRCCSDTTKQSPRGLLASVHHRAASVRARARVATAASCVPTNRSRHHVRQ
jgi:hypothetical protein